MRKPNLAFRARAANDIIRECRDWNGRPHCSPWWSEFRVQAMGPTVVLVDQWKWSSFRDPNLLIFGSSCCNGLSVAGWSSFLENAWNDFGMKKENLWRWTYFVDSCLVGWWWWGNGCRKWIPSWIIDHIGSECHWSWSGELTPVKKLFTRRERIADQFLTCEMRP